MKQLHSERFYLYRADKNSPMTARLTLRMKDAVDGKMLCEAVADTQQRYPYLCVKLRAYKDEQGVERAAFEDNPLPWVVADGSKPLLLMGSEANHHVLAFVWWDDCIAFDFFHAFMDGEAAYRVLRTLLYEYCCRRYDSHLSREGVWVAGDVIDEAEWTDPATMPRPELPNYKMESVFPQSLNIAENPIAPIADRHETVHLLIDEEQMMTKIRACQGTPAVWLSLLLNKAIARLHPSSNEAPPAIAVAVNMRKALGTPLSHHSLVGGISLRYTTQMQDWNIEKQVAEMRQTVAQNTAPDILRAHFWQTSDRMDLLDQLPTLEARHRTMAQQVKVIARQRGSASLSYVGKANLGAAEQFVRELRTESDTPYLVLLEVAAVSGSFCISFIHQFATDIYLDAFLDELQQQGVSYTITGRHPMETAPIDDFWTRKNEQFSDKQ